MVPYLLVTIVFYAVFLILMKLFGPEDGSLLFYMVLGFLILGGNFAVTQFLNIGLLRRRNRGALGIFRRFVDGELDIDRDTILKETYSRRIGTGLTFLSRGMSLLLMRFRSVSEHNRKASGRLLTAGESLMQSALEGGASLDITAEAVESLNQSHSKLHTSIEKLSMAGEDTSSSILEMGASIEEVSRSAQLLFNHVSSVNCNVDEIFDSLKTLQEHIQHLSAFGVETASSMQEMRASIEEVDRHSQVTSERAEESRAVMVEGKEMTSEMVTTAEAVQKQMNTIQNTMNSLQQKADHIDDVIMVITDITRQTNLLALNAAIIAAQGKEKGKSFAVVADEIRDLSERTANSTGEIQALVTGIQAVVSDLSSQLNQGQTRIKESVSCAHDVSLRFDRVLSGLQVSIDSISRIASMTGEQSRNSEMVANAVEEVSERIQVMSETVNLQVKKTQDLNKASKQIVEGTTHIHRSTEEQKKSSDVIQQAVDNIKGGIDQLVETSTYITQSGERIFDALTKLKESFSTVVSHSTSVTTTSESLFDVADDLDALVGSYRLPEAKRGGRISCALPWRGEYDFDPLNIHYMATANVSRHIYETLVDFDKTTIPVPLLADSWEMADGGKSYTIILKEGALFQSGKRVTAQDVVQTFRRFLHAGSPSRNKKLFSVIEGADAYIEGRVPYLDGVRALDDITVQFTLSQPLTIFPALLALNDTAIVELEAIDENTPGSLLSGTGPFILGEVVKNERIELQKNRGYHDVSRPNLEGISLMLGYVDENDIIQDLCSGDLDLAMGISPGRVAQCIEEGLLTAKIPTLRTSFLALNQEFEPLKDVRVRQALNYAVNRERINRDLFDDLGNSAVGILPPTLRSSSGLIGYRHDPEKALDLLKKAGFGNGLRLSMWVREEEDLLTTPIPHILEDFLQIGVFVDLEPRSSEEIQKRRSKGKQSPLFLTGWYADYPDPDSFFSSLFLPESDAVNIHYHNEDVAVHIRAARIESNTHQRRNIYENLDRMILTEAPLLFLFNLPEIAVFNEKVQNIIPAAVPPFIRFGTIWRCS